MSARLIEHRAVRWMLIVVAVAMPGLVPGTPSLTAGRAGAATPTLLLVPDRGHYLGDCPGRSTGVAMALGKDFPEGAGVAIYAMRYEGTPFRSENLQTLLGTVVVRDDGRFIGGNLGLFTLLCGMRDRYPDGTRIEVVAANVANFDGPKPRDGAALARAIFTVDSSAPLPATQRCFSETFLCVQGRFAEYWLATGGLARHGLPLTGEREERLEDGQPYTVQYFERSRLEYHPENQAPNEVLLGQFGRRIRPADPPADPIPGQAYFAETGHNLGEGFLAYWQQHGGLAQFGFPISEVFEQRLEDGRTYRVQYFERARFEHHPENATPYDVLLGQFGRRILAEVDAGR